MRRFSNLAVPAIVLALAWGGPARACDPGTELVISEFMASNDSTLVDEDGDFSDWIEIYDPCLASVNLDGWYLTDDASQLTKWRFPAVSVSRGGFLLIYASGKNRAVAGSQLHTSFKLEAGGEFLALVKPDGTTIAHAFSPTYPEQFPDVSYGVPQSFSDPVGAGATATYRVPVSGDAALGETWTAEPFDDTGWASGPAGLGYASTGSGTFDVTYYKATIQIPDLATAEAVISDPALRSLVVTDHPPTVNYLNTGSSAHFTGDLPFPGTTIGTDANDFAVLVTGTIVIPTAGPWTFGVNSDDGFGLDLSRQPQVFSMSFPSPRGPGDTFATFNVLEPGAYSVRLVFYERGGGSELELFAAPGTFSSFGSTFRLVGDTANGGLPIAQLGTLIGTDVRTAMQGINASLWARWRFNVADPAAFDLLTLRMAYEDGFVAYLNGTEVARRNAPASVTWDSAAPSDRPLFDAGTFEEIDVGDFIGTLATGTNVLAVHGLNDAAADGSFLVSAQLRGIGPTSTATPAYFSDPTPGVHNTAGFPGVSGTPVFSRANGLFTTSFSLTVSASTGSAVIRYTLDGSEPTATHGTVYSGPITVADSRRIRARVFEPGLAPGPVITRLYAKLGSDVLSFNSNLPIVVVDTFGGGVGTEFLTETIAAVIPTSGPRAAVTDPPAFAGPAGLRMRGSSSLGFPKHQYFLEVWNEHRGDQEVSLLGMPSESDWILYAPYTDKTLMRDVLAYKWSNDIGRYAVRTRFVEAFIRTSSGPVAASDYAGVYVLEEKIKQDVNRVNLVDLQPEDSLPPEVTGGYIMKKDRLDPGDAGFLTSHGQRLAYVEPKEEDITAAQAAYLTAYLNQMESALYGSSFTDPVTGYAAYIDPDAFIDHHILVEMTKNIDGFRLSTFLFKDRSGKLQMGPIWDYNLTLGNANYLHGWLPTGWYYDELDNNDYPWWRRIFEDPEFQMRYADRWYALRRGAFRTDRLLGDIDGYTTLLDESQARNYVRWPILGTYVWPNWYIGNTYQDEITWMKQYLADRLDWIDSQFPAPPVFSHPGGQVPTGFSLSISAASGTIYYTLDGSDPRLPGGAVSSSALVYAGPLTITQLSPIKTRSRNGAIWSALNAATFQPLAPIYVNEVLTANVSVLQDDHGDFDPFIELYNPLAQTVELSGFFLSDDPAIPHKWPLPAGSLCGKQHLLVWADGEAPEGALHANFRPAIAGGTVRLYDSAGSLVDALSYPALGNNVSYGRSPDGAATLVSFLYPTPSAANVVNTTSILLNEYNAVASNRFLASNGTDSFWGRVLGNGGDWFELVVVNDHLDLRGWSATVFDNGALSATLVFTNAPILSDLRSGTIITVASDLASDVSYNPGAGDWWINLRSGPSGDGLYVSNLSFSISQQNTQITLRNGAGAVVFGPSGEGISPSSGIGNDEIFKLQQDPGATVTPYSDYQDGTTSTFGAPNVWSGGASSQSFAALRSVVTGACTTDAQCADSNPCTDNVCVSGHCQDTPNGASCDDGDPCTNADACADRACHGQPDGSCCFSDCDCDDGLLCTSDACVDNVCAHDALSASLICGDGNVCTADTCNGATCAHPASGACGLSGIVSYYRDDLGAGGAGSEPAGKPVPGVGVDLDLDAAADATTDSAGYYTAGAQVGDVTAAALPRFGSPRAADHNDAISSLDASVIGRAAVGLVTLSPNQTLAADVTGDGTISAFDASFVGRFATGLIDHFDVAVAAGSDWRFLRCDAYAFPGDPGCGLPSYTFNPIAQAQPGVSFYAVLYGDVTGNWHPQSQAVMSASSPEERKAVLDDHRLATTLGGSVRRNVTQRMESAPAEISIGGWDGVRRKGLQRELTIDLKRADGIDALDLRLTYNPLRIKVIGVAPAGLASGYAMSRATARGVERIALYGLLPLSGSGPVLTVTVEVVAQGPAEPPFTTGAVANEGRIPLRVIEGK